jgi:uroporphyrinogen-III synthase
MSPIVVTRPGRAGRDLTERLRQLHSEVLWWPAFDILPAPDVARVQGRLQHLGQYDLVLFVSTAAVEAIRGLLAGNWPAQTAIGAVGASTRAAAAALPGASAATIIAPADDDESGSEGFWRAWLAQGRAASRILVLRAEHGREWLIERFRQTGAEVDALAVYRRVNHALGSEELGRLQQWIDNAAGPLIVFTSSEAVTTLEHAVANVGPWLRSGVALATHARIAEALRGAGYPRVTMVASDDDAIVGTLESLAA